MQICNTEDEKLKIEYYKCGSMNLATYLIEHDHVPIKSMLAKNGKLIQLFVKCDSLSELLCQWTKNKPERVVHDE